ncbi:glutathione S-transferase 1-1-like [Planococcus citri]|uniref:glutathione S-transferase 1-1-like n=1 Tax=Planococcus citri TaxID=170843 RepID=UPI0031F9C72A
MTVDFYYAPGSAPCRAVILLAKAIGVDLNMKLTHLHEGEHLKPEFLKLNPQHTVPTMDDNGFSLWESRAINTYLVEKYAKDDALLPKDPQKRALVLQRLFFDAGTLYQRFGDAYYPLIFAGVPVPEDKKKKLEEAFEFLNTFLSSTEYAAGDKITLADYSLFTSVTSVTAVDFDISKYTNVTKWLSKLKTQLPAEPEGVGADAFRQWYLSSVKKN